MSFSLVILHHDKAAYSNACLQSVLLSSARPLQVVNVDNGSQDETAQLLRDFEVEASKHGIQVTTLSFETNIGAVAGRNEAMKASHGEYIAFLDNDTVIAQVDWLEKLAAELDKEPNREIVAPKLLFPWAPYDIECCGCAVSPRGKIRYLGRGEARNSIQNDLEIQCAISAAWLMRRRLVDEVGMLDDAFSPVQYEDLDFCYRARAAGHGVWTAPNVEVFHFEHTTTAGSGDINFKYVTAKNGIEFKKRWGATFAAENGTTEDEANWQVLPKKSIEEVDWRALLPQTSQKSPEICSEGSAS